MTMHAPVPDSSSPSASSRCRILVVDDSADLAESLAAGLDLLGFEARCALNGTSAVASMESWLPQIAFVDLTLPDTSGIELLQTARREDWGRDVVMIAMTGWSAGSERAGALEAGFDVFVEKPFDLDGLAALLAPFRSAERPQTSATAE